MLRLIQLNTGWVIQKWSLKHHVDEGIEKYITIATCDKKEDAEEIMAWYEDSKVLGEITELATDHAHQKKRSYDNH